MAYKASNGRIYAKKETPSQYRRRHAAQRELHGDDDLEGLLALLGFALLGFGVVWIVSMICALFNN